MRTIRCKNCDCMQWEKVDITPAGCGKAKYFVRCSQCGLVSYSSEPPSQSLLTRMQRILGL